jgi:predicted peptidase
MLAALAVICVASSVHADTGFLDRQVMVNGTAYRYPVYVPTDYTNARAWPLIVDLHGNGVQGTDGLRHTRFSLANQVHRRRERFPAIIIFPQAPPGHFWEEREMQDVVAVQLEQTLKEFRIDPSRVYLTGFSMGAVGAYRMAYRWPDRFAAIVAIAGRVEQMQSTAEVPGRSENDQASNPFVTEKDPFTALATRIRRVPVWIVQGATDVPLLEQSRNLNAALKRVGAPVRYRELAGIGHNDAADEAWGPDFGVIDWLLKQSR